ncbi:hypothetical protein [uncultured Rothia sp.]|uniref:hypothetical protein n=1 Tax=uncultured Rothia sp. TaxID=316088 RepID=UPI0028ED0AF2|nr:hypothetical protein [uncultured Rothia sp.]
MENQIPAPSFPEQNNANSPQPVPAGVAPGAPLGAAPAGPALGVAPANVRDRDDSYQRIPETYQVPAEHRRPYGETTGDFRGPGYFYSIGAFGASLGALALTLYAWVQVAALHAEANSSHNYNSAYSSSLSLSPNIMVIALLLVGLIPVGVSIWLAIYSAKVNAGHTTKYTSKMTTFNILAYIISGLSLLGLLGTLTMLS